MWWQLLQAAKAGELGDVERLLGEGAEVNSTDEVSSSSVSGCGCMKEEWVRRACCEATGARVRCGTDVHSVMGCASRVPRCLPASLLRGSFSSMGERVRRWF